LSSIESAILLIDSSVKFSKGNGESKLLSADLSNISKKWKLIRGEALLGLNEVAEAGKVAG
jgi:hypothetical protein